MAERSGPIRFPNVVSIVLCRGLLALAIAATLLNSVVTMLQRGSQWRGDMIWTIDWITVGFVVTGPVVAGLVALDTSRLSPGLTHFNTNRLWRTPAFAIAASYVLGVGVAHLLAVGVSLVVSWPGRWVPWAWLAVLAQLGVIAFFVAAGSLAGRLAAPPLAGISAAVLVLLALYMLGPTAGRIGLLSTGLATLPRTGLDYNPLFLFLQLVMLIMVIGAMEMLRPRAGRDRRSIPRRAVGSAVVLTLMVFGLSLVSVKRQVPNGEPPSHCGAIETIKTCFYPEHARVERSFQDALLALFYATREAGYEELIPVDGLYEAATSYYPDGLREGAILVGTENLVGEQPTPIQLVQGLVEPAFCPQLRGEYPPSERFGEDLRALEATWAGLIDPTAAEQLGYQGAPLSPEAAAALLKQFRTCTYEHF